ncbi:MAG: hypothetical protein KKB20_22815 [Proteobacteria bacterium]|nr:hypothetical protein [Pseudomonadota bacterium]
MNKTIPICVLLVLLLAPAAGAVDPPTAITKAQASYMQGKSVDSIGWLREAMQGVWEKTPLTIQNLTLITDQPQGYGVYTPRAGSEFESIDPLIVYFEPIGQTAKKQGDWYTFSMSADFALLDAKDQVLARQADFYKSDTRSRAFNTEFMMSFTVPLKGLAPGQYKAVFTLKDMNSKKKVEFAQPFSVK